MVNLTQVNLQDMLNLALNAGQQDVMNHINAIIGGIPGGSQLMGWNAGVPIYTAPNPIPATATGQPAAQQSTAQVNVCICNEVHLPHGYDGCKEGYESFPCYFVQYINYIEALRKVNTALSFFNKWTADAWGRHYFTINERTILSGTHTMEDFLEAADKYFRDPHLEE